MGHVMHRMTSMNAYEPLNRLVPAATELHLAYPVQIVPAMSGDRPWTVKSDAQNRPLRTVVTIDPATASIVSRENFNQKHVTDRIKGIGIAAHGGQLFGLMNQLVSLATAMGLVLLSVSAVVLWWH
jgi:uncharacterized iron-regulated membrane protein